MHRNGYLWTSRVNLNTTVRFSDPDFLIEYEIMAIWPCFALIFLHFICWKSAIFLLPVCLTYWPRKYTTCINSHCNNFHHVWSRYDHPLPSYSDLAANTLRDLVTFTCDLLTFNSCHTRRVMHPTLPPSWKILCLCILELRVITSSIGHHWKCICWAAHAANHMTGR